MNQKQKGAREVYIRLKAEKVMTVKNMFKLVSVKIVVILYYEKHMYCEMIHIRLMISRMWIGILFIGIYVAGIRGYLTDRDLIYYN